MKISEFSSLTEMARKAPMDREFAGQLRESGMQIIDHAIDVFFKNDREVQEARAAVDDLLDLQTAVRVCVERAETPASDGRRAARGSRSYYPTFPHTDHMAGARKFVEDLHGVVPLYAAVAMVPGPMSLTVKNFAREFYTGEASSSSASQATQEGQSGGGSLLLLGGRSSRSRGQSATSSWQETREYFEKVTTDERVLPVLHDLRARLDQAGTSPANELRFGERSVPYEPDRLYLPTSGISDYARGRS